MSQDERPSVPWSQSDARTAFVATMVGVVLLAWAWWGSSGTGKLDQQTMWGTVSVFALALIGMGNLFWLISGRRAIRRRCDALAEQIGQATFTTAASAAPPSAGASVLVAVAGSDRYHRDTCLLVQGKDVRQVPERGRGRDRLRPCEMCEP